MRERRVRVYEVCEHKGCINDGASVRDGVSPMTWVTPARAGLSTSLLSRTPVVQKRSRVDSELRDSRRMW